MYNHLSNELPLESITNGVLVVADMHQRHYSRATRCRHTTRHAAHRRALRTDDVRH